MSDLSYQTIYDITDVSPLAAGLPSIVAGFLITVVLNYHFLLPKSQVWADFWRQGRVNLTMRLIVAAIATLASMSCFTILFISIAGTQRDCIDQLKSDAVQTVTGQVTQLNRQLKWEEFKVNQASFRYGFYDATECGFRARSPETSPMREGLNVRITHRNGRILKLEIDKASRL